MIFRAEQTPVLQGESVKGTCKVALSSVRLMKRHHVHGATIYDEYSQSRLHLWARSSLTIIIKTPTNTNERPLGLYTFHFGSNCRRLFNLRWTRSQSRNPWSVLPIGRSIISTKCEMENNRPYRCLIVRGPRRGQVAALGNQEKYEKIFNFVCWPF